MILLAIDTASTLCAACVYDSAAGKELGRKVLDLGKGHAEHLVTVVNEAMAAAGADFALLERIVVSVGPGSFTGVRVGVATARGFSTALKVPAVGVSTLEAVAAVARREFAGATVVAALDGGRGAVNLAVYAADGAPITAPAAMTLEEAVSAARRYGGIVAGSAAERIAQEAGGGLTVGPTAATADIGIYAALGAVKPGGEKPKPLYLRDADAKPQGGFILPRIGS